MQPTEEFRYLALAVQREGARLIGRALEPLGITTAQGEVIRVLQNHRPHIELTSPPRPANRRTHHRYRTTLLPTHPRTRPPPNQQPRSPTCASRTTAWRRLDGSGPSPPWRTRAPRATTAGIGAHTATVTRRRCDHGRHHQPVGFPGGAGRHRRGQRGRVAPAAPAGGSQEMPRSRTSPARPGFARKCCRPTVRRGCRSSRPGPGSSRSRRRRGW